MWRVKDIRTIIYQNYLTIIRNQQMSLDSVKEQNKSRILDAATSDPELNFPVRFGAFL